MVSGLTSSPPPSFSTPSPHPYPNPQTTTRVVSGLFRPPPHHRTVRRQGLPATARSQPTAVGTTDKDKSLKESAPRPPDDYDAGPALMNGPRTRGDGNEDDARQSPALGEL
ncbi:hypothetical protein ACOMHN_014915 [Nucella lapillus]